MKLKNIVNIHIVIASFKGYDDSYNIFKKLKSYTTLFYYNRIENNSFVVYDQKHSQKNFKVYVVHLKKNYGHSASPFYHYSSFLYNKPFFTTPDYTVYLHGNIMNDWHYDCSTMLKRIEWAAKTQPDKMISLSGNNTDSTWFGGLKGPTVLPSKGIEPDVKWYDEIHIKKVSKKVEKIILQSKFMNANGWPGTCCGTFILPSYRLSWYPNNVYKSLYYLTMDQNLHHETTSRYAFEFIVYKMFGDAYLDSNVYKSSNDFDSTLKNTCK